MRFSQVVVECLGSKSPQTLKQCYFLKGPLTKEQVTGLQKVVRSGRASSSDTEGGEISAGLPPPGSLAGMPVMPVMPVSLGLALIERLNSACYCT